MTEKQLTESAWKAFAKGRHHDDAALLKAFAALDRSKEPQAVLDALDEIERQLAAFRKSSGKSSPADRELGAHLDEIEKAVAKERKLARAAAATAAADDDEAESPALLTGRMVPLLREVAKGEVVMPALIATTGRETAVLLSRRAIPASRGKLLKDFLGVTGALKLVHGECRFEARAHTFVVQTQASGLAKTLKAALLAQTGLRLKVRVRGIDPNDVDEAGGEADGQVDGPADGSGPGGGADDAGARAAFAARAAALTARVDAAVAARHPDARRLAAVDAFAHDKASAGDLHAASQALDTLAGLLDAATAAAAPASAATLDVRSTWNDAKADVDARLGRLATALRDYQDEQLDRIAEFGLFGLTANGETVALTRALLQYAAAAPARREAAGAELRAAIAGWRRATAANPLVALIDDNPLGVEVALASTLGGALARIEQALA